MPRESIAFGIAGVFFGILIGWIIGSQQARSAGSTRPANQVAAPAPSTQSQPPRLDESRAAALRQSADRDRTDATTRVELGDLYFDAERFPDAARWYEEALAVDPRNVNASTDLGIAYYYMNDTERAVAQFERSLAIDPAHAKTLLNLGIVRAFGRQDLEGAAEAWQKVVKVAPDSPEARMARQALQNLQSAHPPGSRSAVPDPAASER